MRIDVLGGSGGISAGHHTTAIAIGDEILVDAGSGVGTLSRAQLLRLRRVFLSHAHLDHVAFLPFLIDSLFVSQAFRDGVQLEVHALPETLDHLHRHLFNGVIWPDFTVLPSAAHPIVVFREMEYWKPLRIISEQYPDLTVTAFPADHGNPACGYLFEGAGQRFAYSGDTGLGPGVQEAWPRLGPLDILMTECALPNRLDDLAALAWHLTPDRLARLLASVDPAPAMVWVGHMKPGYEEEIRDELSLCLPASLQWRTVG